MPRWLVIAVVAMAALAVASAVMLVTMRDRGSRAPERATALTPDPIVTGWAPLPAFRMTDQDGREQTETVLDGRVTIVDFIFTNCPYACPGMTAEMSAAAEALKDTPVRLLSFSVDPDRDTPERLRTFASEHKADLSRWTFLTGPIEQVQKIAGETLMFEVRPDASRPVELADGTTMSNVVHPSKLFLVGPDRRLIAMYEYSIPEDMLALAARARAAAAELEKRSRDR